MRISIKEFQCFSFSCCAVYTLKSTANLHAEEQLTFSGNHQCHWQPLTCILPSESLQSAFVLPSSCMWFGEGRSEDEEMAETFDLQSHFFIECLSFQDNQVKSRVQSSASLCNLIMRSVSLPLSSQISEEILRIPQLQNLLL